MGGVSYGDYLERLIVSVPWWSRASVIAEREALRGCDADVAVDAAQALLATGLGEERSARVGHLDRSGLGGDALRAVDALQHDEAGDGP